MRYVRKATAEKKQELSREKLWGEMGVAVRRAAKQSGHMQVNKNGSAEHAQTYPRINWELEGGL